MILVSLVVAILFFCALFLARTVKEHFDQQIAHNLMTMEMDKELSQDNYEKNNSFCQVTTQEGEKFGFKVENVMLPWFEVAGKTNACGIELASDDIGNRVENCSPGNPLLNDPKVVKTVSFDDNLDGIKRCVVQFADKPSSKDMFEYLKSQTSYKNITECSEAARQAAKLGEENRQLKAQETDALMREQQALRKAAENEELERKALQKASELEDRMRRLQREADNEEEAARRAKKAAEEAEAERKRVEQLWNEAKTKAEKEALEAEKHRLVAVAEANNLLANEKAANANRLTTLSNLEAERAQKEKNNAALAKANAQKLQEDADNARAQRAEANNNIQKNSNDIASYNKRIQSELDRPTVIASNNLSSFSKYSHMGCFADNNNPRALPNLLGVGIKSVDQCFDLAKKNNTKYFGLQWNSECWGTNEGPFTGKGYDRYGKRDPKECSLQCSGVGGQGGYVGVPQCGGAWTNEVFRAN